MLEDTWMTDRNHAICHATLDDFHTFLPYVMFIKYTKFDQTIVTDFTKSIHCLRDDHRQNKKENNSSQMFIAGRDGMDHTSWSKISRESLLKENQKDQLGIGQKTWIELGRSRECKHDCNQNFKVF